MSIPPAPPISGENRITCSDYDVKIALVLSIIQRWGMSTKKASHNAENKSEINSQRNKNFVSI